MAFRGYGVELNCCVQVMPPSVVRRIIPFAPTAVPVPASTNETPERAAVVGLASSVQVAPPSSVRRIVPVPTANPVSLSGNEMAESPAVVPLAMRFQVVPPSVVRKMVPKSPTAIMVFPPCPRRGVFLVWIDAKPRSALPVNVGF